MEKIKVTAFQLSGEKDFYSAMSGSKLPRTFEGHCIKYFLDGQMIYHTGINKYGERYWSAIGNKPRIDFEFA